MMCNSCNSRIKRGDGVPSTCFICGEHMHKSRPSRNCTKKCADGFVACKKCVENGLVIECLKIDSLRGYIDRGNKDYKVLSKDDIHLIGNYLIKYTNGYEYWFEDNVFEEENECLKILETNKYLTHGGKYIRTRGDIKARVYKIIIR